MAERTDAQLVVEYRETGEIRHFDELVRRHVPRVRAMIYPMVLNDADADELTQEVFLRVTKGISRFKQKAQFSSWLYRITMNTTRSFLKKRNASPVSTTDSPPEMGDDRDAPHRPILAEELDGQVGSALARLSPALRSAITLTAINGMTPVEAAKAVGCMPATMYWRIHEARKALKRSLKLD